MTNQKKEVNQMYEKEVINRVTASKENLKQFIADAKAETPPHQWRILTFAQPRKKLSRNRVMLAAPGMYN